MTCREARETIRRWLEARWNGTAQQPSDALLRHAASCPACAARLEAARLLADGAALRRDAPAGLAAKVESLLAARAGTHSKRPSKGPFAAAPLLWRVLPAAALVAAALILGLSIYLGRPAGRDVVTVRLVLKAPGAASVSVVGDWNAWDPRRDPLHDPDRDGLWEIELRLPRGLEARYQFLVDGEMFVPDPRAPLQVQDDFGGTSSVLQI